MRARVTWPVVLAWRTVTTPPIPDTSMSGASRLSSETMRSAIGFTAAYE